MRIPAMFIEHEIQHGERELRGRLEALERAHDRRFGPLAHTIHRAGRTVWHTNGKPHTNLHVVANHERNHGS